MGSFSRSWELMKVSMYVVRKDKELLVFFLIFGIIMIAVFVSFIIGIFIAGTFEFTWMMIVFYFVMYVMMYLVGIYFNIAIIGCATIRLEGGDPMLSDGFRIVNSHIGRILAWALIVAIVGFIFRAI